MNLRALIFDVDGTLVDSVDAHARAWHEAFTHFKYAIEDDIVRTQIGKGGDQLLPSFLTPAEIERDGEALEAFRSDLWKIKYLPRMKPFAGVRALFERLNQQGILTAVASSCKADELSHYLDLCHISDLVRARVCGDDVEHTKPHPDIVDIALRRLGGLDPSRARMVGDSPYDMEAAGKIGVRGIGMKCGGFSESSLTAAGAEILFRDPEDLLARLDSLLHAGQSVDALTEP